MLTYNSSLSYKQIANIFKSVMAFALPLLMEPFHQMYPTALGLELRPHHHSLSLFKQLQQPGAWTPSKHGEVGTKSPRHLPSLLSHRRAHLPERVFLSLPACHKIIISSGLEPWSSKSSKPFLHLADINSTSGGQARFGAPKKREQNCAGLCSVALPLWVEKQVIIH